MKYSFLGFLLRVLLVCAFFAHAEPARSQNVSPAGQRPHITLETGGDTPVNLQPSAEMLLDSFTVQTSAQQVEVLTGLRISNPDGIKSQLRDGAVMMLSCIMNLERIRTLLSNEQLSVIQRTYQLRHDPLTREFMLSSSDAPTLHQGNFDSLLNLAWKELHFTLPLLRPLSSGETYRIRLEMTLQHTEVPPWLEKALFFWSWDVCPRVVLTQDFTF